MKNVEGIHKILSMLVKYTNQNPVLTNPPHVLPNCPNYLLGCLFKENNMLYMLCIFFSVTIWELEVCTGLFFRRGPFPARSHFSITGPARPVGKITPQCRPGPLKKSSLICRPGPARGKIMSDPPARRAGVRASGQARARADL